MAVLFATNYESIRIRKGQWRRYNPDHAGPRTTMDAMNTIRVVFDTGHVEFDVPRSALDALGDKPFTVHIGAEQGHIVLFINNTPVTTIGGGLFG